MEEHQIKLQTEKEARQDAEKMAKANTVNAMTAAAQKTGLEDGAAQEQQQQ